MAIQYNYNTIARDFNFQQRNYFGLSEVTPEEVKMDIRNHSKEMRSLLGMHTYVPGAYAMLKKSIVRGERVQPPDVGNDPALRSHDLADDPDYAMDVDTEIPAWLRKAVLGTLHFLRDKEPQRYESQLFGLLLACWAYSDRRVRWRLELLHKRWRITKELRTKGEPMRFFQELARAQVKALEQVKAGYGLHDLDAARDFCLRHSLAF
ncbi:MAG: hypothetical protein HY532_09000 [Chloroflexi bacterium]|nr:hypothetical protein [Chloroflexota bacterium]